jgi:hypothetical protein
MIGVERWYVETSLVNGREDDVRLSIGRGRVVSEDGTVVCLADWRGLGAVLSFHSKADVYSTPAAATEQMVRMSRWLQGEGKKVVCG